MTCASGATCAGGMGGVSHVGGEAAGVIMCIVSGSASEDAILCGTYLCGL